MGVDGMLVFDPPFSGIISSYGSNSPQLFVELMRDGGTGSLRLSS